MKKIISILGSPRLAILLFFILAVFSIFGTIIPQGMELSYYVEHFGKSLGNLIITLKLDDVYHSWWYVGALFLFLLNLIICSIERFPLSWKLFKKDPFEVDPEKLPTRFSFKIKASLEQVEKFVKDNLGFVSKRRKNGVLLVKDKNRWGYLSVYVVHVSLVLIILGALIGALKGFRGDMWLIEGTKSNQVTLYRHKGNINLNFYLKLNKFKMEFYPNGMVKEYISNVTVIDGKHKFVKLIRVNHPLKYKGISFYQASYQELPSFEIRVKTGKKTEEISVAPMNPVVLDNRYLVILEAYSAHHPQFLVIKLNLVDQDTGNSKEFFLISNEPKDVTLSGKDFKFSLTGMKVTYISILQVKKDPGLIFVFVGFGMMIFGLLLVYFFEPKTFWIYLEPEANGTKVIVGAAAKRERDLLRLKVEEIAEKIEKAFS